MKLIMCDLDGTLFDTKEVNFSAYQKALSEFGYSIDYKYFCSFCNGRHYLDFLPVISINDKKILSEIHSKKKEYYSEYINKARLNERLLDIIRLSRLEYKTALVTTASKENTYDLLNYYHLTSVFDLILTHEDIKKSKPDPEGYLIAMSYFQASPSDSLIFEDSEVGIQAAKQTGATVVVVEGFN